MLPKYGTENHGYRENKERLRGIEDQNKRLNIHLNKVPKGEHRDNTHKAIFKEKMGEFSRTYERHKSSDA